MSGVRKQKVPQGVAAQPVKLGSWRLAHALESLRDLVAFLRAASVGADSGVEVAHGGLQSGKQVRKWRPEDQGGKSVRQAQFVELLPHVFDEKRKYKKKELWDC